MIFVYTIASLAVMTTSATPATEETELSIRGGSGRMTFLSEIEMAGKAQGATSLSGLALRVKRFTTVSSGGGTLTPSPQQTGAPAAKCTAADASTALTAGTVDGSVKATLGCGGSSGNQWIAPDIASMPDCGEAGAGDCLDFLSQGGAVSMLHQISAKVKE